MDRLTGWLQLAGVRGWQLAGAAVGLFVFWTIFQRLLLLIVTVFVALLIAALLTPVARWLERLGIPRTGAVLLTFATSLLALMLVMLVLGMRFLDQMSVAAGQLGAVRDNVVTWLTQGPLDVADEQIADAVDRLIEVVVGGWSTIVNRTLFLVAVIGALVTALVLAFFLMRDTDRIKDWALERLVSDDQRADVAAAGGRAGEALQGYIRATLIIGALDGLFVGVALVALGVPLAVPLALLTFLGGFFPVIGATVAGLLATVVAAASQGLITGLLVLAIIIVIQQVDGNLFQPVIMGHAVHLHPIVVLTALSAGGILAGIIGAFMAVPTTAVLTAVGTELRRRRDEQAPLTSRPAREPRRSDPGRVGPPSGDASG